MDEGRRTGEGGLTMLALRAWMWAVPIMILAGSAVFTVIAAIEGDWALMGAMIVFGLFGLGLGVLHAWLLYRFGRTGGSA